MLNSNFPYQHQRELLIKLSDFTDLNVCLNLLNFDIANYTSKMAYLKLPLKSHTYYNIKVVFLFGLKSRL
jgi:hypothetical protein